MPPDNYRDSSHSVELALSAIQGSLTGYKASVDQGMRDLRDELRDHVRDEKAWQERIEDKMAVLITLTEKVETLKKKVDEHDRKVTEHEQAFQQLRGAALATRVLWALVGFAVAGVGWLLSHAATVTKTQMNINPGPTPTMTTSVGAGR